MLTTTTNKQFVILANSPPVDNSTGIVLNYRIEHEGRNIRLELPGFTKRVGYIPERTLDLIEIASYVYGADRYSWRGSNDAVEYTAWARSFIFHICVRDYAFWSQESVQKSLDKALRFVTGDRSYEFQFYPGHKTEPTSLFDSYEVQPAVERPHSVALFSGGLDSLAGALELLQETENPVLLVSHQSQPGTKHTQDALVNALKLSYQERVLYYPFACNLTGVHAREETQRSRSFLYTSVAFAVAEAFGQRSFFVFENGITSINLSRRDDLINARASRTTHPKTIALFERFFTLVADEKIRIEIPYLLNTKAEVFKKIVNSPSPELISSSVSCSRTYTAPNATHCGECFQCLDRRLAGYAVSAQGWDHSGLYAQDIIESGFSSREAKTTAVDYLRQAVELSSMGIDHFYDSYLDELADTTGFLVEPKGELEKVGELHHLFQRHGTAVLKALRCMRDLHDDLRQFMTENSLLRIISEREYLQPATDRLVTSIMRILTRTIPLIFRGEPPKNENDLNQKIAGILNGHEIELRSEHPSVPFACARVIPDHELTSLRLLIEAKYIRINTPPSKATEGIAADLTKYPDDVHILFVVLDLDGKIPCDDQFQTDIEKKGRCNVLVLR